MPTGVVGAEAHEFNLGARTDVQIEGRHAIPQASLKQVPVALEAIFEIDCDEHFHSVPRFVAQPTLMWEPKVASLLPVAPAFETFEATEPKAIGLIENQRSTPRFSTIVRRSAALDKGGVLFLSVHSLAPPPRGSSQAARDGAV